MPDIASLGIQVTSNGVQKAADDLDKLGKSGDGAAESIDSVGESAEQAAARIKAMVQQSTAAGNGATTIRESQRSLAERLKQTTAAMGAQTRAVTDWAKEQAAANARGAEINAASTRAAKAASDAVKEGADAQRAALAKLVGQIDPTVAALGRLDAQQAKLAQFRKAGIIGADDFAAFNARIEENRVKVTAAGAAMHKFSLNTAASRRELGYIAKDLATGQFGRLNQSLSTLAVRSGALSLLMSPLGLAIGGAAAAATLFAAGAAKGAAESEELRKSVIATGQAAGLTGVAFSVTAKNVGDATRAWSDSAKAVSVLAKSTQVAGASVGQLATASVNMAKVTGQSVQEAAQEILNLGKDPVNAVVKLNEKYNILTAAQYAHIQALQDSGREEQAAAYAQGVAAQEFQKRADEVQDGSGIIIRAAHAVGNAWDKAWNSIKDIGATKDPLTELRNRMELLTVGAGLGKDDSVVKALQAQIDAVLRDMGAHVFDSTNKALEASANQAAIAAQQRLSKFQTPKQKLDAALVQANKDRLAALRGVVDPADVARINAQADLEEEEAKKAYENATKKLTSRTSRGSGADPFQNLSGLVQRAQTFDAGVGNDKANNQQVQSILAIVNAGAKLIQSGQDVAKVQALVSTGVSALNDGYAKQAALLREQNTTAIKAYQDALDQQIADKQRQIDLQVAAIGMGQKEAQQQLALANVYSRVARTIEQLNRQRAQKGANTEFIDAEIAAQRASIPILVKQEKDKWGAIDAAQADGMNGARAAISDFLDEQNNVAAQSYRLSRDFIGGFGDAFAKFASGAESAKKAFGDFADSLYQEALKLLANQGIAALFRSLGLGGDGSSSGGFGGGGGGIWSRLAGMFGPGTIGAGLATGGEARAGSIHPVNENGPELLTVRGRHFLMMGNESGKVTPVAQTSTRGGNIINVSVQPTSTRQTAFQVASATARALSLEQSRR